jgi:hypothetical protein
MGVKPQSTGHDTTKGKNGKSRKGVHYVKMTQTSLLRYFGIFRLLLSPDDKESRLMREDWWLRNQPPSMNADMENLARTIEAANQRYKRVPIMQSRLTHEFPSDRRNRRTGREPFESMRVGKGMRKGKRGDTNICVCM